MYGARLETFTDKGGNTHSYIIQNSKDGHIFNIFVTVEILTFYNRGQILRSSHENYNFVLSICFGCHPYIKSLK